MPSISGVEVCCGAHVMTWEVGVTGEGGRKGTAAEGSEVTSLPADPIRDTAGRCDDRGGYGWVRTDGDPPAATLRRDCSSTSSGELEAVPGE